MQIEGFFGLIPMVIVIGGSLLLLFLMFYVSRYRKFRPNEYVIHLRNGRVLRSGTGGRVFLLPVLDEVIVIPTTVQQTLLEARERVVSHEYQDVSITAFIYWRVANPEIAFKKVSFVPHDNDYVETIIKNAAESIMRTTCANLAIEDIIRERERIIKQVTTELHTMVDDWGLVMESVEIKDVEVLDRALKENLEAIKKLEEEQRAKLRRAEMTEITQIRDLDVNEKTGLRDQQVQLTISAQAKEREIKVQELEMRRAVVEADTRRKEVQIKAEAKKFQLSTEAEGEAQQIKQRLLAEAEGQAEIVKQQAEALKQQATESFLQLKIIEALPEIFKNIKVDQMMLLGESGDEAFNSIAKLILPFAQIAKNFLNGEVIGDKII
ncbi:MAG: SPFH domain-containing protein [Promethearchaeota archaeon]